MVSHAGSLYGRYCAELPGRMTVTCQGSAEREVPMYEAYYKRTANSGDEPNILTSSATGSFEGWDELGPYTSEVDLDGNTFAYQLPPSWGQSWKKVNFISIARAGLVSTLPREWGLEGAFPVLKRIWLYSNPELTGAALDLMQQLW